MLGTNWVFFRMTAAVPPPLTLDEIEEELQECEAPNERLEYLIELGATSPTFRKKDASKPIAY